MSSHGHFNVESMDTSMSSHGHFNVESWTLQCRVMDTSMSSHGHFNVESMDTSMSSHGHFNVESWTLQCRVMDTSMSSHGHFNARTGNNQDVHYNIQMLTLCLMTLLFSQMHSTRAVHLISKGGQRGLCNVLGFWGPKNCKCQVQLNTN